MQNRSGRARETVLGEHEKTGVALPDKSADWPVDGFACQISAGSATRRNKIKVVRAGAFGAGSEVGNGRPIGRDFNIPKWPSWPRNLPDSAVAHRYGKNLIRPLVGLRAVRTDDDETRTIG
jgi:hypothetical protein